MSRGPMSSLPPERSLVFSPSLAATIGLSEAILLQLLADLAALQGGPVTDLRTSQLQHNLPFWSVADLERIAHSLRDKGVISLYSGSLAREGRLRFSLAGAADARLPATAPAPAPGAHRLARSEERRVGKEGRCRLSAGRVDNRFMQRRAQRPPRR